VDFVPGVGSVVINLGTLANVTDISFDASNNHIIIVGEVNSPRDLFIVKINATDGSLFIGGNYSAGLSVIDVAGSTTETIERANVQSDGTILGLGTIDSTGRDTPYLVKITANGALDLSFNSTGFKTFDLALPGATFEAIDLVQLADTSLLFSVYNLTSNISHIVKTDTLGNLETAFSSNGILNLALGATGTKVNNMTLDSSENLYIAGFATNVDDDYLLIKISSITGILDPLFNAFNTPGYLVFDEGVNDTQLFVTFDPFQQRIILISIVSLGRSPTDSIRLRGLNLVQDDIGAVPPF
jgi:hypothetical protein